MDDRFDVIVVGGGGSGLASAVSAVVIVLSYALLNLLSCAVILS